MRSYLYRVILFFLRQYGVLIAAASRTAAPRVARQALQGLMISRSAGEEPPVSAMCMYTL